MQMMQMFEIPIQKILFSVVLQLLADIYFRYSNKDQIIK